MKNKNPACEKVKAELRLQGVPVWRLAEKEGVSENTMFRRLRHDLPDAEQERLVQLVREIAREW